LESVYQWMDLSNETTVTKLSQLTYDLSGQLRTISRFGAEAGTVSNAVAFTEYTYDFAGPADLVRRYAGLSEPLVEGP